MDTGNRQVKVWGGEGDGGGGGGNGDISNTLNNKINK